MAGCSCGCKLTPISIFACSGSADVGELADRAARQLTRDGFGQMSCLAGIGGRVNEIMKSTGCSVQIVMIDGCPLNCGKYALEQAAFTGFIHLQLAELGFEKSESEVNDENIAKVADTAISHLREVFGKLI